MLLLPDLNVLGEKGCYAHVATERRVWSGKTRLVGVLDLKVADDEWIPSLAIRTRMEAPCWIRQDAVKFLWLTPAPYPNPPAGRLYSHGEDQ